DEIFNLETRIGITFENIDIRIVDGHAGREVEALASAAGLTEVHEQATLVVEHLHVLERRIADVKPAVTVNGYAFGSREAARFIADPTVHANRLTVGSKALYTKVARLHDVYIAFGPNGDVGGMKQFTHAGAGLAEPEQGLARAIVEHLDLMMLNID